ncbi:sulfurtransferase [Massilia sp. CF038]|uniref:sulfurtransferase n=1 Tax=Massilia sp. CF038 TaxID=1881045 RepID=UPI0009243F6D|nr:sulfurtransferase [Massilia sp. CF038]SHH08135.1 Rhodanese-related sulfurtransferase [Massilia sp. CF038]
MKAATVLTAAALILSTGLAWAQQTPAAPAAAAEPYKAITQKLNRQQLDGLLTYPDQVLLVDVRRPDEITAIGGFPTYLSVQAKDIESGAVFIPRDRSLITISNHAGRALKAADALLAKGFKVAGAVGVQDYEAEGGKLTRIAAPAPKVAAVTK